MGGFCGSDRLSWRDVVACLCACFNNVSVYFFVIGLNTLFTDWQDSFKADRGSTVSVQAVCMGFTTGAGLIAGVMERKFGQRMSLLLGSFLSSAGFFAGAFAGSLPVLVLCVGVVSGSGYALVNLCNVSCALQRFSSRATFVSSLLMLVSSVIMLSISFFFRYFTETYTWRGCLILASALNFHSSIASLLLTSPLLHAQQMSASHSDLNLPISQTQGSMELQTSCPDPALQGVSSDNRVNDQPAGFRDAAAEGSGSYDIDLKPDSGLLADAAKDRTDHNLDLTSVSKNVAKNSITDDLDLTLESTCSHGEVAQESLLLVSDVLTSRLAHNFASSVDSSQLNARNGSKDELAHGQKPSNKGTLNTLRENIDVCQDHSDTILSETEAESLEHGQFSTLHSHSTTETVSSAEESPAKTTSGTVCKWIRHAPFLTNPLYVTVVLCLIWNYGMVSVFLFLILDYAKDQGWALEEGLFINFVFMISNFVGRVLVLVMSLHRKINSIIILGVAGQIGGLAACVIGQVSDYILATCLYAALAVCLGWSLCMFPPSVLQASGRQDFSLALGLGLSLQGTNVIACNGLAGFLVDNQGSYRLVSLVYGLTVILASGLLLFVFKCRKPAAVSVNG